MSIKTLRKIMWVIGIINIVCLLYMGILWFICWNTSMVINPILGGILRGLATLPFFYLMLSMLLVIAEIVLTIIMIILQLVKFKKAVKTDFLLLFFYIASMPLWWLVWNFIMTL